MRSTIRFVLCACLVACVGTARAGSYEDFFAAVERDDVAAVRSLLQRGFDPNTRDPKSQVGLFLALRAQSMKVADVLALHPSTDIDAVNPIAETPLMMAALRGDVVWCRRLVAAGARIDRDGWTPLHYAAAGPNGDLVAWLIEQRVRPNVRSPNGTTPLMMAAGYGNEAGADVLARSGADPSLRNQQGMNAADFARSVGRDALALKLDRAHVDRLACIHARRRGAITVHPRTQAVQQPAVCLKWARCQRKPEGASP